MMNRNILNPMMWTTGSGPTPTGEGIYWNSSLGLISLSSDGTSWITIADKNLGATQVYNDGDTLTNDNCGNCFQWGNNARFPLFFGAMSTSRTSIDATNYGPYYENNTFILGGSTEERRDWSTVHNANLWGGVSNGTIDRIGPALNYWRDWRDIENYTFGYLPSSGDFENLRRILDGLGANLDNIFMPAAGGRMSLNGEREDINNQYWSCSSNGLGYGYSRFGDRYCSLNDCTNGFPIRCFISNPGTAEDEVTLLTTDDGYIKRSPSKEYIKLKYRSRTVTIMDKNLGATQIWQSGVTKTSDNCGHYFQRGNIYGFPGLDTPVSEITTSNTQVDATNYGPYCNLTPWRYIYGNWSSVNNVNLWGDITGTMKSRRGPCDKGYHIPSDTERLSLYTCWTELGGQGTQGIEFRNALKLPFAGYLHRGLQHFSTNRGGYYRTTKGYEDIKAYCFSVQESLINPNDIIDHRTEGLPIRPFKNEPIEPDSTWTRLF